jgi:hypothetical protein
LANNILNEVINVLFFLPSHRQSLGAEDNEPEELLNNGFFQRVIFQRAIPNRGRCQFTNFS